MENIQSQEKSEEEMKSTDKTFKNGCLLPAFKIHLASNFIHTSGFPAKPYYFHFSCHNCFICLFTHFWGALTCALSFCAGDM